MDSKLDCARNSMPLVLNRQPLLCMLGHIDALFEGILEDALQLWPTPSWPLLHLSRCVRVLRQEMPGDALSCPQHTCTGSQ